MKLFSQLGLLVIAMLMLTGCPKKEMMEAIKGKKWILETLNGAPAKLGRGGEPLFIQLDAEDRLAGFSGCNRFFGAVEIKGNKIKVGNLGSTMMACPPEFDDAPLHQALQSADQVDLKEGKLLLKKEGLVIATFSEEGVESAAKAAEFRDTHWVLQALNGEAVKIGEDPKSQVPFIQFPLGDQRARGHAGCNSFGGAYESDGQSLTFGPLMSTRMACPSLELEGRFLKALESVDSFMIEGQMLTMMSSGVAVAVFKAE